MHYEQPTPDEADQNQPEASANPPPGEALDEQVGDVYRAELPDDKAPVTIERLDEGDRPRIWVGSWLDYNNGVLYGQWIDADRDADDLWGDIETMLAASPTAQEHGEVAEDWGIFDHENFGDATVSEQDSIDRLSRIAKGITEHGQAFAAWAELTDFDATEDADTDERFSEAYLGEYDSLEAYAEQLLDDLGYQELLDRALPEHLHRYVEINLAGFAQDLWLSGDVALCHKQGGGVWLFDNRN
ncbi:MAG: antirestriction protein ArdA [Frankiales bacterium]|nr:antirestriction protein ArdA [Frankiales bacterium]